MYPILRLRSFEVPLYLLDSTRSSLFLVLGVFSGCWVVDLVCSLLTCFLLWRLLRLCSPYGDRMQSWIFYSCISLLAPFLAG